MKGGMYSLVGGVRKRGGRVGVYVTISARAGCSKVTDTVLV